jgi:hypothetical protein
MSYLLRQAYGSSRYFAGHYGKEIRWSADKAQSPSWEYQEAFQYARWLASLGLKIVWEEVN